MGRAGDCRNRFRFPCTQYAVAAHFRSSEKRCIVSPDNFGLHMDVAFVQSAKSEE
jgi:hypothetical protein